MHRDLREHGDVARARQVTGRVEPVGSHEVRVVQADARARARSSTTTKRGDVAARRGRRERIRGVVRALDQRALQQVAHGDALARDERDALLADLRGRRARPSRRRRASGAASATITVISFVMLAIGTRDLRVVRREHLAVRRVDDVERPRVRYGRGAPRAPALSTRARRPRHTAAGASAGTLLDADSLPDLQRVRADARVQRPRARTTLVPFRAAIEPNVSPLCTVVYAAPATVPDVVPVADVCAARDRPRRLRRHARRRRTRHRAELVVVRRARCPCRRARSG